MLHTVALENFDVSIVHTHRHGNNNTSTRPFGAFAQSGIHAEIIGGLIKLITGLLEDRGIIDRVSEGHGGEDCFVGHNLPDRLAFSNWLRTASFAQSGSLLRG